MIEGDCIGDFVATSGMVRDQTWYFHQVASSVGP